MKKVIIVSLGILMGIGLVSYPHLATYLSKKNASTATQEYGEEVGKYSEEELAAQKAAAEKYNKGLTGEAIQDPFMEGSGMVRQDEYLSILNIEGSMGYISIPEIDLQQNIHHGTSESVLQSGIGHLEGSSLPIGGENTHTVLTGHTGLMHAKMFTDLIELREGDVFYLHILDEVLAYQVDQIKVVDPTNVEDLKIISGEDYTTLVTCTPYGVNSHRLLVRGTRIPYEGEEETAKRTPRVSTESQTLLRAAAITGSIMLVLIILALIYSRKKRRKQALYQWYLDQKNINSKE